MIERKKKVEESISKIKLLKKQIIYSMRNDSWSSNVVWPGIRYNSDKFSIIYHESDKRFNINIPNKIDGDGVFSVKILGFSAFEFWFYRVFFLVRRAVSTEELNKKIQEENGLINASKCADAFFKTHKDIVRDNKLKELTK